MGVLKNASGKAFGEKIPEFTVNVNEDIFSRMKRRLGCLATVPK
jgi:hypothetical protein